MLSGGLRLGVDQKSSKTAMGKDVGVTGRGHGAQQALKSTRSEAGAWDRGLDYLVGRVCSEIRLYGQDTETSMVPWKKCREANREWPYRT